MVAVASFEILIFNSNLFFKANIKLLIDKTKKSCYTHFILYFNDKVNCCNFHITLQFYYNITLSLKVITTI